MRRLLPLTMTFALLVLGGCGADPGNEEPDDSSAVAGKTAARAWADARARLVAAGSGRYDARIVADGLDQPVAHESGTFSLDPASTESERTFAGIDETTQQPRQYVVRVRQTADGRNFLQLADWGTWAGCWLPMSAAGLEQQTGIEVNGAPRLPAGARVLLAATVSRGSGTDAVASAGAVEVLQFLGVSAAALSEQRKDLAKVEVPVVLGIGDDGDAAGISADGVDVLHALDRAGVRLGDKQSDYVGKARAELALKDLGTKVAVAVPDADRLLPEDPTPKQTCPANR